MEIDLHNALKGVQQRLAELEKHLKTVEKRLERFEAARETGSARLSDCLEDPEWVRSLPRDSTQAIVQILAKMTNYSISMIKKKAKDLTACGHDAGEVLTWALNAHRHGKYPLALFLRNLDHRPAMGSMPWGPQEVKHQAGPSDTDLNEARARENAILGVPQSEANRNRLLAVIAEYKRTGMTLAEAYALLEKGGVHLDEAKFEKIWSQ
jgi:uncharacterized protein YhaN